MEDWGKHCGFSYKQYLKHYSLSHENICINNAIVFELIEMGLCSKVSVTKYELDEMLELGMNGNITDSRFLINAIILMMVPFTLTSKVYFLTRDY